MQEQPKLGGASSVEVCLETLEQVLETLVVAHSPIHIPHVANLVDKRQRESF